MSETHQPEHDEIARRAHEISESGESGSEEDNWRRAERELRERGPQPWAKTSSGDAEHLTE